MRQIQDKTPQTLTTIKQQPLNVTMTAPTQRAAIVVKEGVRTKGSTCGHLSSVRYHRRSK